MTQFNSEKLSTIYSSLLFIESELRHLAEILDNNKFCICHKRHRATLIESPLQFILIELQSHHLQLDNPLYKQLYYNMSILHKLQSQIDDLAMKPSFNHDCQPRFK